MYQASVVTQIEIHRALDARVVTRCVRDSVRPYAVHTSYNNARIT